MKIINYKQTVNGPSRRPLQVQKEQSASNMQRDTIVTFLSQSQCPNTLERYPEDSKTAFVPVLNIKNTNKTQLKLTSSRKQPVVPKTTLA